MASNDDAFKAGELKGQTQEKAAQMMEGAKDMAEGAKDKAFVAAEVAKDKVSEVTQATKDKTSDATQAEQNPKQSPGGYMDTAKEKLAKTAQGETPGKEKGVVQATADGVMGAAAGAADAVKRTLGMDDSTKKT